MHRASRARIGVWVARRAKLVLMAGGQSGCRDLPAAEKLSKNGWGSVFADLVCWSSANVDRRYPLRACKLRLAGLRLQVECLVGSSTSSCGPAGAAGRNGELGIPGTLRSAPYFRSRDWQNALVPFGVGRDRRQVSRFQPRETLSAKRTGWGTSCLACATGYLAISVRQRQTERAGLRAREQPQLLDPALPQTPQLNGPCGSVEFGGAKPRRAAVCTRRGGPGLVKGWSSRRWHAATDEKEGYGIWIESRYSARGKVWLGNRSERLFAKERTHSKAAWCSVPQGM